MLLWFKTLLTFGLNSAERVTDHPLAPPLELGSSALRVLGSTYSGAALVGSAQ